MRVIQARNVHTVLPLALRMLQKEGIQRDSRNGPVLVAPWPVSTVYEKPSEKVVFWQQRDYNVAFVVYEALWMLAGRNDLAPLQRYVKNFDNYSDDGKTLHGAYGHRWRKAFGFDQLNVIADRLRSNPEDRRCVLQIWDAPRDLGGHGRDFPCNDTVTFQRGHNGELNMVVFCRSNDILWGAYYANAFHFAVLQEYVAVKIGCPIGTYTQVSVNWHGYLSTLQQVSDLPAAALDSVWSIPKPIRDPYADEEVKATPLDIAKDDYINDLLWEADAGFGPRRRYSYTDSPFFRAARAVLKSHEIWRTLPAPHRFDDALAVLAEADYKADIVAAAERWIQKRRRVWEEKVRTEAV